MTRLVVLVVASSIIFAAPVAAQSSFEVPPTLAPYVDLADAPWGVGCVEGSSEPTSCAVAVHALAMRRAWERWVDEPTADNDPWPVIDVAVEAIDELGPAAAAACAADVTAYRERIAAMLASASVARRLDAVALVWLAAGEGVVMPPDDDASVDTLTGLFGIPAYCDRDVLNVDGRWGRLRITVGDTSIRMIQNPLERLLMCSNFLTIVSLRVSETGPHMFLVPLAQAGLVPEPYASMSAAELIDLQDAPQWQAIVADVPADRLWWQMVEHPAEQLTVWTRAFASGFIDTPAALLYGARTLSPGSREALSRALAESPDVEATRPALELQFRDGAAEHVLPMYAEYVPADFAVPEGGDGLVAILGHEGFRDAFLAAIGGTGWNRWAPESQYRAVEAAAEYWMAAAAAAADSLICLR